MKSKTAAKTALWLALSASPMWVMAQEGTSTSQSAAAPAAEFSVADLERAFWICDHAATTRPVDTGSAVVCTTITEQLKERKFNGDFDALVTWWRHNKPAEHEALEAGFAASAALPADSVIAR